MILPTTNILFIIDIIIFIQGILLSFILLSRVKFISNLYLGIFLLFLSLFGFFSTIDIDTFKYPTIILFSSTIVLLFGPLVYRYIWYGLFNKLKKDPIPLYIHLLPFLISILSHYIYLKIVGTDDILSSLRGVNNKRPLYYIGFATVQNISGLTYSILALRLLIKNRVFLQKWTTQKKRFRWFMAVLITFTINWIVAIVDTVLFTSFQDFATLIFMYVITFFSIKYPIFLNPIEVREEIRKKLNLDIDFIDETLRRLSIKIDNKFYLEPEVTLLSLSNQLGLHSNALSFIINEKKGMGFRKYINSLRLEEFLYLYKNKKNGDSQLQLAMDAGFSSKSTFLRSFKESYHMTPQEYLKQ